MAVALRLSLDDQVREVAAYTQDHLIDPSYWCQGGYARTLAGALCAPTYAGASYWSLSGAVYLACAALGYPKLAVIGRLDRLAKEWGHYDMAALNDDTSFEVVKAFLDEASRAS